MCYFLVFFDHIKGHEANPINVTASWDDWVPQDRIRKNSDENKELAANLKSELDRLTRPAKAPVPSTKKKAASSDLSSLRGSEERLTPVTGRGQKRGRDNEIEKVGDNPQEAQRPQRKKKKTAKAKALDPPKETNLPTKVLEKVVKPGPTAIKQEPKSRKRALGSPKEATPPSNGPENVAKSGPTAVKTRKAKALEPPKETIPHANASQKETKPGPPESTKEPKSRKRALEPDNNKERPPKKTRITRSSGPLPGADLRPRPAGYYVTAGVSLEPEANKLDNIQEDTFNNRPAVHIPTPDNLKSLLVDDWEFVTKNLTVVPLPSQYPVNKIIDTYFEEEKPKRRMGSADMDILHEVKAGLKDYFEKTLGRILLYRFERQQYLEVYLKMQANKGEFADKTIGDIYGPEHLARLLGMSLSLSIYQSILSPFPSSFPSPFSPSEKISNHYE